VKALAARLISPDSFERAAGPCELETEAAAAVAMTSLNLSDLGRMAAGLHGQGAQAAAGLSLDGSERVAAGLHELAKTARLDLAGFDRAVAA